MNDARLVASRYAQALSDAVPQTEDFERAHREVRQLADLVRDTNELRHALANPVIPSSSKEKVLLEIAERAGMAGTTSRFISTLADHDRLDMLADVADALNEVADARNGIHEVEITSASPLEPALRERLTGALSAAAGGRIRLSEKVDPELLGGVVARVGATVYDGSLKTRLHSLRAKMIGGASGSVSS